MKNCTFILFLLALSTGLPAQGIVQIGSAFIPDIGNRMIVTPEGDYITAGSSSDKAALYRSDCRGNVMAQLVKTYSPGPARFHDVVVLPDGNIVAVGGATIITPTDTLMNVILLKTNPLLVEIATANFLIQQKSAEAKSIALSPQGELLLWGEVTGFSIDFTDAFFQRVDPITLQPVADPVIFNNGVDLASRILPTADGHFLLTGNSFFGNIFNPDAPIDNVLRAYLVNANGALVWEATVRDTFLSKYGVATVCGAAQSSVSGNFILGGTMYGDSDERRQDAFFALINQTDGVVLDTLYAPAPAQQHMFAIRQIANNTFSMLGDSEGSAFGVPFVTLAQVYEIGNTLLSPPVFQDPPNIISVRDFAETDPGRFAYMGILPDNQTILSSTNIIIVTPGVNAQVAYQNCALAVASSTPGVAFQWVYEGQAIPGANQGVYFPDKPGLYQVQVLDNKGCVGVSDTFRIEGPTADFSYAFSGLSVDFTNTSAGANLYTWDFGDGSPNSGLIDATHTYAAAGVYTVTLIARNACGLADTVQYTVGVTPAEEPLALAQLRVQPNPSAGLFTLEIPGLPETEVQVMLHNAVGQLLEQDVLVLPGSVLQKNYDLSPMPNGVYTLHIQSGKLQRQVKVLKTGD